jgi:hypothetical protein
MGKYSRQLSARLRNGYDYELFRKVTQDDIFPVTKILTASGYNPDLVELFEYFKDKEHWSNGTYYAILDKDCDCEFFVGSELSGTTSGTCALDGSTASFKSKVYRCMTGALQGSKTKSLVQSLKRWNYIQHSPGS